MGRREMKYNDYPLEEIQRACDKQIAKGATCYQKWSCKHCGSRQTMPTPNTLHKTGICDVCDSVTTITKCNYMYTLLVKR